LLKETYNLVSWIRLVQEILKTALKFLSFKGGGNFIAYLSSYELLKEIVAEYLHLSSL